MNIPVNLFMWIMAPVGLLITVVTGVAFYKADITLLASESAKGVWNALIILIIVWTAILMYQVGDEAKAFLVIRNGMRKLLPNELLLVLAMGWIFESFLQGGQLLSLLLVRRGEIHSVHLELRGILWLCQPDLL